MNRYTQRRNGSETMELKQNLEPAGTRSELEVAPTDREDHRNVLADPVWDTGEWSRLEAAVSRQIIESRDGSQARHLASRWGRKILRSYSSSFFTVTRWLPETKRADVEMVYAAVRYPDEVVDTFDLASTAKIRMLEDWRDHFEDSAYFRGVRDAVAGGIPVAVAGFRDVARRNAIPDSYYTAFLRAMRTDVVPRSFESWDSLVEDYVYGSATVVGYFLAHIYGPATGHGTSETMSSARALAVALQLTNFARDVGDDSARGRCYLPSSVTGDSGASLTDLVLAGDPDAVVQARLALAREAGRWYEQALPGIPAFAPDSRLAIEACHRLYSKLNDKILVSGGEGVRASLSYREKLSVLPRSKYWRLPMAMVFER